MWSHGVMKPALLLTALLTLTGCGGPISAVMKEPLEVNATLTLADWSLFEAIMKGLPEGHRLEMPPLFPDGLSWDDQRTLPVCELILEEKDRLNTRWKVDRLVKLWERDAVLRQVLRRHRLSLEQFASLYQVVGLGAIKSVTPNEISRSQAQITATIVAALEKDDRIYAALSPSARHHIARSGQWMLKQDCQARIAAIPKENGELIEKHAEWLRTVTPGHFWRDPLQQFVDRTIDEGLPFEEGRLSDRQLRLDSSTGRISVRASSELTNPAT